MRTFKARRWFIITSIVLSCISGNTSAKREKKRKENSEKCDCGIMPRDVGDERIINGRNVYGIEMYPWMVTLVDKDKKATFCGGTIISSRVILTAAHCLLRKNNMDVEMYTKCMKYSSGNKKCWLKPSDFYIKFVTKYHHVQVLGHVLRLVPHKDYDPQNATSDIALITLKKRVKCTDCSRPICLPLKSKKIRRGDRMIIAGWGTSDVVRETFSKQLKHANLTVIDNKKCLQFPAVRSMQESVICLSGKGKESPCFGDSGGPVMKQFNSIYFQFGVASLHVSFTCDIKQPVLYTDVQYFLPWIKNKMRKTSNKKRKKKEKTDPT